MSRKNKNRYKNKESNVPKERTKKITTKKKKVVNVDELNAYKVAYGKPMETRDYIFYIGGPALLVGGFGFLLLYYWWLALIMAVVGGLYGAKFFLPKAIQKEYEGHSFKERNKFLNNMTQILTDDSKTVTRGLSAASARAEGEFKEDLQILQARLLGADNSQIQEAFMDIADKYNDDVIFVQYMEQLETTMLEGKTNIDTLKDIKSYHNDIKEKQENYQKLKDGHLKDMKMLMGVMVVFVLAIATSFTFSLYLEAFARTFIGWITVGIYGALMAVFFRKFSVYLFDDSVLEVKK